MKNQILNKLTLVVAVTAGWLLSSATVRAQDTNAPKTKLEAFEAQTGIVLIKGTASLGAVPAQAGTVLVRYKESTDTSSGRKMHGVAIEVKEGDQKEDTTIVDYDELDAFLNAIDYVGKVDYTVTPLPAFEAVYATRGGLCGSPPTATAVPKASRSRCKAALSRPPGSCFPANNWPNFNSSFNRPKASSTPSTPQNDLPSDFSGIEHRGQMAIKTD
jgi:hypothetical protein